MENTASQKGNPQTSLPFSGVKVLSFAQLGQGPAAVQSLADFGADVVKVERPGTGAFERGWAGADAFRDGVSYLFLALNRNQRSLTVNLKHHKGRKIICDLVKDTDILVENFRPDVMDRLGLGYKMLSEINPRLIYCSTSGFGSTGPYRNLPGQDLILQCYSGLAAMTGCDADPPTACGTPIVDFHAGALLSFAMAMALFHREKTGRGQYVETSLLEGALGLQLEGLFYFLNGWDVTKRGVTNLASPYHAAPYGIYRTEDSYICLSLVPLSTLRRVMDIPQLSDIPEEQALERRDEIVGAIAPVLREKSTDNWISTLREAGVWCGPVNDYRALTSDPHFQASDVVLPIEHSKLGRIQHIRPLVRLSEVPIESVPQRAPPDLGEHTGDILGEIGLSEEEIRALREHGVV